MMVSHKTRKQKYISQNSICTTFGFGMGLLLGAFLLESYTAVTVWVVVLLSTTMFHYTFSTNSGLKEIITKVIKKGS